jgi:hypothetical protein
MRNGQSIPWKFKILNRRSFEFDIDPVTSNRTNRRDFLIVGGIRADGMDFYPVTSRRKFSDIQLCTMDIISGIDT